MTITTDAAIATLDSKDRLIWFLEQILERAGTNPDIVDDTATELYAQVAKVAGKKHNEQMQRMLHAELILRSALERSKAQFEYYAANHAKRDTDAATEKMLTNLSFVSMCQNALDGIVTPMATRNKKP